MVPYRYNTMLTIKARRVGSSTYLSMSVTIHRMVLYQANIRTVFFEKMKWLVGNDSIIRVPAGGVVPTDRDGRCWISRYSLAW